MTGRHVTRASTALVFGVLVLWNSLAAQPAQADPTRTERRAIDQAASKIQSGLSGRPSSPAMNVAVIPLRGDEAKGYATSAVRSAVSKTSHDLFTRDSNTWDALLAEIQWGQQQADIMDSNTVQRFGRIHGVDAILYGRIWDRGVNIWSIRGFVTMSVHLADVETGQVLWSSGPVQGEAYIHWSDALTQFWKYPLLIVGGLVALVLVVMVLRGIGRAIRHATRPL